MSARQVAQGLVTGGRDGLVKVWKFDGSKLIIEKVGEDNMERIYSLSDKRPISKNQPNKKSIVNSQQPEIKSVYEHPKNGFILVGTRGGEIYEFEVGPGEKGMSRCFMKSHYDYELNGLAIN
jgi:hypothetical protein